MNNKLNKIGYILISILAGITVGIVLSVYVGILACIQTLINFPMRVYYGCMAHRMAAEINNYDEAEDIWSRHIEKIERNSKEN
jgi:uncharacterized membrane protein|tara:strand:+ start:53 stop:301 length:249 start_codon:yes stop_codon:yes gene_type:complete